MEANVWITTRIVVNRTGPGPVHLRFGLSSKLKYVRILVDLPGNISSEDNGMP